MGECLAIPFHYISLHLYPQPKVFSLFAAMAISAQLNSSKRSLQQQQMQDMSAKKRVSERRIRINNSLHGYCHQETPIPWFSSPFLSSSWPTISDSSSIVGSVLVAATVSTAAAASTVASRHPLLCFHSPLSSGLLGCLYFDLGNNGHNFQDRGHMWLTLAFFSFLYLLD